MKKLVVIFALAALAGCSQRAGCDRSAEADLSFSAADAPDHVTAMTLGPSCDKAIGVLVVRAPDGRPMWAWTAPLHPTFGNLFAARSGEPPDVHSAEDFVKRWAVLRVSTTADAPPWPANAQALSGAQTTLDRLTYEDVRARRLPMACHLNGVAHEMCIFWEPAAAGAAPFIERDICAGSTE